MREPSSHSVAGDSLAAATATPLIRLDDPARKDSTIGFESLPGDDQAQLVQAAVRSQIRTRIGSVEHVEVFRLDGVGTSILGRPRHLPRDRRASPTYTLIWEEPP